MAKNARIALEESVRKCVDDAMTDAKILESLSETLLYKRMTLVKAFRKFDLSHEGKVSREEFAEGLKECGVQISDERAAALIDKFGKLACWEFIRMMSASENDDDDEGDQPADLPGTPTSTTKSPPVPSPSPSLVGKDDETEDIHQEIGERLRGAK